MSARQLDDSRRYGKTEGSWLADTESLGPVAIGRTEIIFPVHYISNLREDVGARGFL